MGPKACPAEGAKRMSAREVWKEGKKKEEEERKEEKGRGGKRGSGRRPEKNFRVFKNTFLPPFPASFGVLVIIFGTYAPRSSCW